MKAQSILYNKISVFLIKKRNKKGFVCGYNKIKRIKMEIKKIKD
jgi:hypothetical protein